MNHTAFKAVLLLLIIAVAVGVCAVLSEFNHMLGPAGGINVLNLEDSGCGVYRIEFLGEKMLVDLPQIKKKVIMLYNLFHFPMAGIFQ